jgi:hypothetical protein
VDFWETSEVLIGSGDEKNLEKILLNEKTV